MSQPTKKFKTSPMMKVQLRSENAKVPTKGSPLAAGYDLYASNATVIPARGRGLVDTDVSIQVPIGTYGRVAPRSGLAVKKGINTGAGVVDADYTGEIKVVLFNHSDEDFVVEVGDRVAQFILEKIVHDAEIQVVDKLDDSTRGEAGFGSTGSK